MMNVLIIQITFITLRTKIGAKVGYIENTDIKNNKYKYN
ncbi:hypothetical protein EZS27_002394 [termite gut metagenome]|uniref:Uncharacterized protein n=1 Tax=termite gut metagenome TaxID=433724 RepID=A0A5J4SWB8_9ZZZZ